VNDRATRPERRNIRAALPPREYVIATSFAQS